MIMLNLNEEKTLAILTFWFTFYTETEKLNIFLIPN